jgi:HK97 family phage portal protein
MKIFGFEIGRKKELQTIEGQYRDGWRRILEPFSGAWQQNTSEKRGDLITYPTLYACLYRISSDIGKLPFMLTNTTPEGITRLAPEAQQTPYAVLKTPNAFQTEGQFREYWMLSKLTQGNTYVLKRRDQRGMVVDEYILDPERVMPMVSDSGEVFYQLYIDPLNTIPANYPSANLIVPASEIIHDRCMCVHNPLIGIPPLAAAYWPALKNMKIMRSATEFFANNAQPGGILTAPAGMSDQDADAVKQYWATNFTGQNSGRIAIIGADMKFTAFAQKSVDSQMVEQMRYSDEQICQPFGIPPFKVGIGSIPSGLGVDGLNQLYYADALQPHIEHMEALLDKGLNIKKPLGVELDLEPLLRMDQAKRADVASKLVGAGIETPNEGRLRFNYGPLVGGDTVYLQQQDFPLDQVRLNKIAQPLAAPAPAPEPEPAEPTDEEKAMIAEARAIVATNKAIEAMRRITNV